MTEQMSPRNATSYTDRHGKLRWRFRRHGLTFSLKGQPGDEIFEKGYHLAEDGVSPRTPRNMILEKRKSATSDHYFKPAIQRAKSRAKRQKVTFNLSIKDAIAIMDQQEWKCAISGIQFGLWGDGGNPENKPFRPSLDRIVPAEGYKPGNVRIVCEIVNLAMNVWGEEPLKKLVAAMAANRVANRSG